MIEIKLKGHKVSLYNSIDELPIDQYNLFQCYLIQDLGIGRENLISMISEANTYLLNEQYDEASKILTNYYRNIDNKLNQVNIKWLSFGCLLDSYDDEKVYNYSKENLESILDKLSNSGLNMDVIKKQVPDIKKNWTQN